MCSSQPQGSAGLGGWGHWRSGKARPVECSCLWFPVLFVENKLAHSLKFGALWVLFPRSHIFGPKENPALSGRGDSLGVLGATWGSVIISSREHGGHLLRGCSAAAQPFLSLNPTYQGHQAPPTSSTNTCQSWVPILPETLSFALRWDGGRVPLGSETPQACSVSVCSFSTSFARSVGTPHLSPHDPRQGPRLHLGRATEPLCLPTPSGRGSGGCTTPTWDT